MWFINKIELTELKRAILIGRYRKFLSAMIRDRLTVDDSSHF